MDAVSGRVAIAADQKRFFGERIGHITVEQMGRLNLPESFIRNRWGSLRFRLLPEATGEKGRAVPGVAIGQLAPEPQDALSPGPGLELYDFAIYLSILADRRFDGSAEERSRTRFYRVHPAFLKLNGRCHHTLPRSFVSADPKAR